MGPNLRIEDKEINGKEKKDAGSLDERNAQSRLEDDLSDLGDWRFNTINAGIYHKATGKEDWIIFDDRMSRTIRRYFKKSLGKGISSERLKDTVGSDFSDPYDPMKQYFADLPKWNESSHGNKISEYANTLNATSPLWNKFFKKWLVGVVANVHDQYKCKNHHCLTLVGEQGDGKSTFLNGLFPKKIIGNCYTGKIKVDGDFDLNAKLSQNMLIHIEEVLPKLLKESNAEMKEIMTKDFCNYCRKYENQQSMHPRMASFMASLNDYEFLVDASGDRRYLVFMVVKIAMDKLQEFDVDMLWAQAYTEWKNGFQYWFKDGAEVAEIMKNNEQFRYIMSEQDWLTRHFEFHSGPDAKKIATHHYTATDFNDFLREKYKDFKVNKKTVGIALKTMGLKAKQGTTGGRYYYVTPLTVIDEDERMNSDCDPEIKQLWDLKMRKQKQAEAKELEKESQDYKKGITPNSNF
jgi:predicted P-loop ATPase